MSCTSCYTWPEYCFSFELATPVSHLTAVHLHACIEYPPIKPALCSIWSSNAAWRALHARMTELYTVLKQCVERHEDQVERTRERRDNTLLAVARPITPHNVMFVPAATTGRVPPCFAALQAALDASTDQDPGVNPRGCMGTTGPKSRRTWHTLLTQLKSGQVGEPPSGASPPLLT